MFGDYTCVQISNGSWRSRRLHHLRYSTGQLATVLECRSAQPFFRPGQYVWCYAVQCICGVSTVHDTKGKRLFEVWLSLVLANESVLRSMQGIDERVAVREMFNMLNDETFQRSPEMTRALVSGCVSFQIPVKLGMKLVTQIASLFWSFVHVLCNVEIGNIGLIYLSNLSPLFVSMAAIRRKGWVSESHGRRGEDRFALERSDFRSRP